MIAVSLEMSDEPQKCLIEHQKFVMLQLLIGIKDITRSFLLVIH